MNADRKSLLMIALMMFFLIVVWAYKTAELKNEIEQLKFEASFRVRQRDYHAKHNFARLIGRFRHMTGNDKGELKNVVERLKMVNTK